MREQTVLHPDPPEPAETRRRRVEQVLEIQFEDLDKQTHAAHMGMWVFLVTEVLLFGALFTLYASYRLEYPQVFAEAAGHTALWIMTGGTVDLLTASFLVALAVWAIRRDRNRMAGGLLAGGAVLAAVFLGLKAWEYVRHIRDGIVPGPGYHYQELKGPGAEAFFNLYYLMTGLHAVHVTVGVLVLTWISVQAFRRRYDSVWHTPLELGGMYWHLVDALWLFLWPFFYLMR